MNRMRNIDLIKNYTSKMINEQKIDIKKNTQRNNTAKKELKTIKPSTIDTMARNVLFLCAAASFLALLLITVYILVMGTPIIFKIGIINFVFGKEWNPTPASGEPSFGIFPMVIASFFATIGSVLAATFFGVATAIFLAEIAPAPICKIFKPAIEILAGIPSVVYGFFGLVVIVPLIRTYIAPPGNSLFAGIIILTFMILPTIINISEEALKSVPYEYKEGSYALGATCSRTIFSIELPAAKSGIMASIILGTGRAIGETMAVILVTGNSVQMPKSLFSPVRTLTANIALEMGYAFGEHENALFATGVVLFLFIMAINIIFNLLFNKNTAKHHNQNNQSRSSSAIRQNLMQLFKRRHIKHDETQKT